ERIEIGRICRLKRCPRNGGTFMCTREAAAASARAPLRVVIYVISPMIAFCCAPDLIMAQQINREVPKVVTIQQAVDTAMANYPAGQVALARARAARAGVAVAQTVYLPRADLLWQENRATDNNVTGLLIPQSVIPSISGPVKPTTSWDSVWGSAAGTLL